MTSDGLSKDWELLVYGFGISMKRGRIDEWPLANILDAAIDEQRRRRGRVQLDPRTDVDAPNPVMPHQHRWPGVNMRGDLRRPGAGAALCDAVNIRDDDLRRTVINVHLSTFGSTDRVRDP